jgi:hypothetical protein
MLVAPPLQNVQLHHAHIHCWRSTGRAAKRKTYTPTHRPTHTHTHTHTYPPLVKFRGICGKSSLHHVQLPVWQQDEATPPYRLSTAAGRKGCAWIVTTLNAFNHAATVRNAAKGAAQSGMPTGGRSPLRNVAVPPLQQLSHTAGTSRTSHHDASPPVCGSGGPGRRTRSRVAVLAVEERRNRPGARLTTADVKFRVGRSASSAPT